MADGTTRAIKDVRVGDDVIATDPATGKTSSEPVTALHINQDTDLTDVWVTHIDPHNAPPGPDVHTAGLPQGWSGPPATYLLHTTANHLFWNQTTNTWTDANNLLAGDHLHTTIGDNVIVTATRSYTGSQAMHNLTINQIHTYYVIAGNTPVLVHNDGGDDYLYRGVPYGHPGYDEATRGIATPWGGHESPALHNGGNTRSGFTSWTTDPEIARGVSREGNGPGVVLRVPKASVAGQAVSSPDIYAESEILLKGKVTGAAVTVGNAGFPGC
jgi:hypothetical protein